MKKFLIAALFGVLFTAVPHSYGQMDMEKRMQEHMGGGMMTGTTEKKETKGITREAEAAGVTVKVTCKNPFDKDPVFDVALDTRAADLDRYRFEEIAVLRDDSGKVYNATLVSSSGSGRHREANL